MTVMALLLLQSAPLSEDPALKKFDLRDVRPAASCDAGGSGDAIVVCGRRRRNKDIVVADPAQLEDRPVRADADIKGLGHVEMRAIESRLPGASGMGAAITLKVPF